MPDRFALAFVLALTALGAGCGDERSIDCGPGTTRANGMCIAATTVTCPPETTLDAATGACVPSASLCGDGTVLSDGLCVRDQRPPMLPTADLDEAAEPNDVNGRAGTIAVPAAGAAAFTAHGCIAPYADVNRNGVIEADQDSWTLHADGPLLLEVAAVGVGGLEPAFQIVGNDPDLVRDRWSRVRMVSNGIGATWKIYMPVAGDYELDVQDANALLSSLGVGGAGACYFLTFRRLELPAPADLPASFTTLMLMDAPAFFRFAAAGGQGLSLAAETSRTSTIASIVVVLNGSYLGSMSETEARVIVVPALNASDSVLVIVEAEQDFNPPAAPVDFLPTRLPQP